MGLDAVTLIQTAYCWLRTSLFKETIRLMIVKAMGIHFT